jgi:hypothetical protein
MRVGHRARAQGMAAGSTTGGHSCRAAIPAADQHAAQQAGAPTHPCHGGEACLCTECGSRCCPTGRGRRLGCRSCSTAVVDSVAGCPNRGPGGVCTMLVLRWFSPRVLPQQASPRVLHSLCIQHKVNVLPSAKRDACLRGQLGSTCPGRPHQHICAGKVTGRRRTGRGQL